MGRLLRACAISLLLYGALFGFVLDRPLTNGFVERRIEAKLARAAAISRPKLVILAGSNGPYSHRCQVLETLLGIPCVNGGVAVGIGLDYLFARWRRELHPGDTVYLPMEEVQYAISRANSDGGPDAQIMIRHDWRTLAGLAPRRWASAFFSFDLRFALMAGIEHGMVAAGFRDPRPMTEGVTNSWGDHVGHTLALAAPSRALLAAAHPWHATAALVARGYGTRQIVAFLLWAKTHGVRAIGGLPTEFADAPMPPATEAAIRAVYVANGADFLVLPNHSLYPRTAFFDTPDHLSEPWQLTHSVTLARALGPMLGIAAKSQTTSSIRNGPFRFTD
jgi:hypothetical protein